MGLIKDLSAAFVAFVIEVDDALEARRPGRKGPWLTSVAMWRNCMQWVPAEGITVAELIATARTPTDLHGMRRWGYVEVDGWARSASGPPPLKAVVRPTGRGARVAAAWDGIPAEVEERWGERHGSSVAELRAALVDLAGELDPGLPDTMPIVRHGWATRRGDEPERRPGPVPVADLGLDSLLARALTAFANEYEATGKVSDSLSARTSSPFLAPSRRRSARSPAPSSHVSKRPGTSATARSSSASAKPSRRSTSPSPSIRPAPGAAKPKELARLPRFPLVTHRGGFPDGA